MMWTGFLGGHHRRWRPAPFELDRLSTMFRDMYRARMNNAPIDDAIDELVELMTAVDRLRLCDRLNASSKECRRSINAAYAALAAVERALGADQ